jgi:hypothetical protein
LAGGVPRLSVIFNLPHLGTRDSNTGGVVWCGVAKMGVLGLDLGSCFEVEARTVIGRWVAARARTEDHRHRHPRETVDRNR